MNNYLTLWNVCSVVASLAAAIGMVVFRALDADHNPFAVWAVLLGVTGVIYACVTIAGAGSMRILVKEQRAILIARQQLPKDFPKA